MKVAVITIEAPLPGAGSRRDAEERARRVARLALSGVAVDAGDSRVYGRVTGVTTRTERSVARTRTGHRGGVDAE